MFSKLLKYEWKAVSRLLGILSLCVLGAGVLGGALIRLITFLTSKAVNDSMAILLIVAFFLMLIGLYVAILVYAAGTNIYLLFRFYKTRFTDEGYLTFTLPVSNRSILLSAYVNNLLWSLISTVTTFLAIALALVVGLAGNPKMDDFPMIFAGFGEAMQETFLDGYLILQGIGVLLSGAAGVMISMASVTVGAVIAKKHKILAAIGIYYAQSLVMGMLGGILQVAVTFMTFSVDMGDVAYALMSSLTYVLQAAWGVGAYFLSMHLINKKLNLP